MFEAQAQAKTRVINSQFDPNRAPASYTAYAPHTSTIVRFMLAALFLASCGGVAGGSGGTCALNSTELTQAAKALDESLTAIAREPDSTQKALVAGAMTQIASKPPTPCSNSQAIGTQVIGAVEGVATKVADQKGREEKATMEALGTTIAGTVTAEAQGATLPIIPEFTPTAP